MNRIIFGILLFFCLIAPVVATFTFLQYHKIQVRQEVKRHIMAGIDKKDLVLLKFTQEEARTELTWEHNGEFEYRHQMYDIVATENRADSVYYWCWWDSKENKLNKQLDKLLEYTLGNDTQQEESQKKLSSFYKSLYFEPLPTWGFLITCSTERMPVPYAFVFSAVFFSPPFPPPRR